MKPQTPESTVGRTSPGYGCYPLFTMPDLPVPGDWECEIGGPHCLTLRPPKGHEPNAFHRLMQSLVLGFRWSKREGR